MKCILIVYSYHHNNTRKVAEAMSEVLGAVIQTPSETKAEELPDYDLIGFGAGIDSGRHYGELLDFAAGLPPAAGRKCFIFSTSAVQSETKMAGDHARLREILRGKGYETLGEFSCKGFNTNSFLKVFGGMNRGRPNREDLEKAKKFAWKLKSAGKAL